MTGLSPFYLGRWRGGQMYMDRAEQLVRLADGLRVATNILVDLACGTITAEEGLRIHSDASGPHESLVQLTGEASLLNGPRSHPQPGARARSADRSPLVLVISTLAGHRAPFLAALRRHGRGTGLLAENLSVGLIAAERYRPQITFLDLAISPSVSLEACRVISRLTYGSHQRCRVVVGTAAMTDAATAPALMAGAAAAYPTPFQEGGFLAELGKLQGQALIKRPSESKPAPTVDETIPAT